MSIDQLIESQSGQLLHVLVDALLVHWLLCSKFGGHKFPVVSVVVEPDQKKAKVAICKEPLLGKFGILILHITHDGKLSTANALRAETERGRARATLL